MTNIITTMIIITMMFGYSLIEGEEHKGIMLKLDSCVAQQQGDRL